VTALRTRESFEAEERERLAPYAIKSGDSRGRVVPEPPHPLRTAFQRDRDRIVHSRAFRRLEYKTQVFVQREGDHFRNRLTHTLEGSQIARTIARALRLNEELAEAIALAHDLGHPPFGHAGERVLAELMRAHGGFDHNRQSLRVVDLLEERYPRFRGLNLCSETREGILKHGSHWEHPVPLPPAGAQPCLEAQVADCADEIAYVNHDVDDGLRSGLLSHAQLAQIPLWAEVSDATRARVGTASESVLRSQTIGTLIDRLVSDLVQRSAERLASARPASPDAVRAASETLIGFSPDFEQKRRRLKRFLYDGLYQHPQVIAETEAAVPLLREIFEAYVRDPVRLPEHVRARFASDGAERAIADYIAGMTDGFARRERARLGGVQ
jgi:dGTPase